MRAHYPLLHRARFFDGVYDEELGIKDVTWLAPDGEEMTEAAWHDAHARALMMRLDGHAPSSGLRRAASNVTLLMILNGEAEDMMFTLPLVKGEHWRVLIDTAERSGEHGLPGGAQWHGIGRSLTLMAGTLAAAHPQNADAPATG